MQAREHDSISVTTLESRVLASAQRLKELKAVPDGDEMQIKVIEPLDRAPRAFQVPALSSMPQTGISNEHHPH